MPWLSRLILKPNLAKQTVLADEQGEPWSSLRVVDHLGGVTLVHFEIEQFFDFQIDFDGIQNALLRNTKLDEYDCGILCNHVELNLVVLLLLA